jgi:hypothetical protein
MAIQTYVPLANFTATGTTTSVTFNNLPSSGYRDLVLVMRPKANDVNSMNFQINGNGSLLNGVRLYEAGSVGSNTYFGNSAEMSYVSSNEALLTYEFLDYNQTDKLKTILIKEYEPARFIGYRVYCWTSTAAITNFSLTPGAWPLVAGASFELYGVAG